MKENYTELFSIFYRKKISVDSSGKTLVGIECPHLAPDSTTDSPWPAASHLQVSMIRGVAWHYKQLVAFDFTGMSFINFTLLWTQPNYLHGRRLCLNIFYKFITGLSPVPVARVHL
jgi:hypothetical protein